MHLFSKKLLVFSLLIAVCAYLTSCSKDELIENSGEKLLTEYSQNYSLEESDLESTNRRTYTGEEVNRLVEEFSGIRAETMTVKEKMMVMANIRESEYNNANANRSMSYLAYAVSKIEFTDGTESWVDDGDYSPSLPTIRLRALADQIREHVNATQVYCLSLVRRGNNQIIDYADDNEFNYSCNGHEKYQLRLRSSARVYTDGSTNCVAYKVCVD